MIGYVGVEEQVDRDFHRALMRATLHRWWRRLVGDGASDRLRSFDEAKVELAGWCQSYRGVRAVEVEKIIGSVGRYRDFDASFRPLRVSGCERWSRVDRAYHRGTDLPAVSLYKVGGWYFVRDGNHRVSVARYHGVAAIDAEVVEVAGSPRPLPDGNARPASGTCKPARRTRWGSLWRTLWPQSPGPVH